MVNYETLYTELNQHTSQLSALLAEKRKQLDNNKTSKDVYKQISQIEKEVNLNYNILKSLMKLSVIQKLDKLDSKEKK